MTASRDFLLSAYYWKDDSGTDEMQVVIKSLALVSELVLRVLVKTSRMIIEEFKMQTDKR